MQTPLVDRTRKRKRRRIRHQEEAPAERAARWLLILAVMGSVLAIGAVHVPVLVVVACVALGAGALTLWNQRSASVRVPPPALLLGALGAYTALQAIPLPMSWLARLDPLTAEIWARSCTAIGAEAPRWVSISLDPGASWVEALKWWAYAAVFVAAAAVGEKRGVRWGASLLLVSAAVLAVLTVAHGALDATAVYGIYEPRFGAERWQVSPLVNPNNLAGYLNLGALGGLGLLGAQTKPAPRWAIGLGVATLLGASILSASRGGLGALAVGVTLLAFLLARSRRRASGARALERMLLPLVVTVLTGVGFALIALNRHTLAGFLQKDVSKLEALGWLVPMIGDHPWVGIGRGAFQTLSPHYYLFVNDVVVSHPENFVVQWAAEWGLPVAIVGLGAVTWLFRPKALGYVRSPAAMGVFAGLFALVVQNLLDLSLEVPGVMFAAVTAAACLWGGALHAHSGTRPDIEHAASAAVPQRARARVLALAAVAVSVAFVLGASIQGSRTVLRDRDDLLIDFPSDPKDTVAYTSYRNEIRAAMRRHPAEPYFPRVGALLALRGQKESPMPWLGLALERASMSGRTNYLLALHLARRGALDQALIELRLAADYAPGLADRVGAFAVKLKQDPEWLSRVAPDGRNGAPVLFSLATHLPSAHARAQDAFLEEATARDPAYVEARTLLVKRLLAALEEPVSPPAGRRPQTRPDSGRCAGVDAERCARVVVAQCAALERLLPDSAEPVIWRARAYMLTGRPAVAAQALSTECARLSDRQECLGTWLEAAASARKADMVARAAKELELGGCAGPDLCASAYEVIADALDRAGDKKGGLDYYEKAARQRPTKKRWQRAADAAAAIGDQLLAKGDVAGAIAYSERAARTDPTVARWRRVAELKEPRESATSIAGEESKP